MLCGKDCFRQIGNDHRLSMLTPAMPYFAHWQCEPVYDALPLGVDGEFLPKFCKIFGSVSQVCCKCVAEILQGFCKSLAVCSGNGECLPNNLVRCSNRK
jgi:hypothetical protein